MNDLAHKAIRMQEASIVKRIDKYLIKKGEDECWDWSGIIGTDGRPRLQTILCKVVMVSRLIYILDRGPFDSKLLVLHKCDNPSCLNPKHLFLGTYSDNTNDCIRKGRRNNNSLTIDQVKEIKDLLNLGMSKINIARQYRVSKACIQDLASGRSWSYVKA